MAFDCDWLATLQLRDHFSPAVCSYASVIVENFPSTKNQKYQLSRDEEEGQAREGGQGR